MSTSKPREERQYGGATPSGMTRRELEAKVAQLERERRRDRRELETRKIMLEGERDDLITGAAIVNTVAFVGLILWRVPISGWELLALPLLVGICAIWGFLAVLPGAVVGSRLTDRRKPARLREIADRYGDPWEESKASHRATQDSSGEDKSIPACPAAVANVSTEIARALGQLPADTKEARERSFRYLI